MRDKYPVEDLGLIMEQDVQEEDGKFTDEDYAFIDELMEMAREFN